MGNLTQKTATEKVLPQPRPEAAAPQPRRTGAARQTLIVCVLLVGTTVAAFWPLLQADFINFDDPVYVTGNQHLVSGMTWANAKWAFQTGYAQNWHPLTWLSHILDAQLFGLKPFGHHLVNLLLHLANTLLLFFCLKRMTGFLWRSAFVAALFAIHPLHVESVAWVAERKDVLSGFFFMLTLLAYADHVPRQSGVLALDGWAKGSKVPLRNALFPKSTSYALALLFFALGLLSKPMLVTLPFILLLLDIWPLHRIRFAQDRKLRIEGAGFVLLEKLPFFALSVLSSLITLRVQSAAMVDPNAVSLLPRTANAALACAAYLRQTFWPAGLAVFYPYPTEFPVLQTALALVLLLGISAAVLLCLRRWPFAAVGWFWYLGMLVPVIGLVQVGTQAHADRYTYLPLLGVFILVTWAASELVSWRPATARIASVAALGMIAMLALITHRQAGYWQNSEKLFTHAANVTKENYIAWSCLATVDLIHHDHAAAVVKLHKAIGYAQTRHADVSMNYYMGAALAMQGKGLEALPFLEQSKVMPEQQAYKNYWLGLSQIQAGRIADAETSLNHALSADPGNAEFQLAFASLRHSQGRTNDAERLFRQILSEHSDMPEAERSYADFLLAWGRPAEAEAHYAATAKLAPPDAALCHSRASALARMGKAAEAIKQLQTAVTLAPTNAAFHFELAELLSEQGQTASAISNYQQTIRFSPTHAIARNNLAWVLATNPDERLRNGARAVELARQACELAEWKSALLIGTLAAAHAEAGDFSNAVTMAERARDTARAGNREDIAKRNQELLELYRASKPFHETR
jgi:Flp pilus assembly protein TadD